MLQVCCAAIAVATVFLLIHSRNQAGSKSDQNEKTVASIPSYPRSSDLLQLPAIAAVAQIPEWQRRLSELSIEPDSDVLGEIAATVPDDQIRETLDILSGGNFGGAGLELGRLLIQRWVKNGMNEPATWAEGVPDGEFGRMACREIATAWAQSDLANAAAWARQLPDGGNKSAAQLSLSFEAALRGHVAGAISLAANVPPGANRDEAMDFSVRQWAITDPNAATSWAEQLPNTPLHDEILADIATDLAVRDPFRAAQLLASASIKEDLSDKAALTIVRFWTSSAPERAADWVAQFPESELRGDAMKNMIDVWARNDFAGAGEWLMHQPDGPARSAAIATYESAHINN